MSSGLVSSRTRMTCYRPPSALLGFIGIEHDHADSRARRSGQALADDVALVAGCDSGVQQLIERRGIDAQHRFVFA